MNHKRAFTLVELMLALAVTGLLVVVLINIANTTSNAWLSGEAQAESYANARGSINLMAREIKGAVVDLDLGFAIGTLPEESNNFVLKFLTRTGPTEEQNTPVRKIAYQLGWADSGIIPEITTTYDNRHRTPVLVRTLSNNLDDVFQVKTQADEGKWVKDWGGLPSGVLRAGAISNGTFADVAAENVLGWQVIPMYWDKNNSKIRLDEPGAQSPYYDKYLTSDKAPRALQVKMATVPSRAANLLSARFPDEWSKVRDLVGLFDEEELAETPFTKQLRQNLKYFDATINLSSKTP